MTEQPSWRPVWQHVGVALGIVAGLTVIGIDPFASALMNAVTWILREAVQAYRRDKSLNPYNWSLRKLHEWIAPSIAGAAMAWIAPAILDLIARIL